MRLKVERYYKESDVYFCWDIETDKTYYFDFNVSGNLSPEYQERGSLVGKTIETNDFFTHVYISNDPKIIEGE